MSNNSLASLLAPAATTISATSTKGLKPIGSINVKLAGVTLFNRPVWKESTSETAFLNELNDLAQLDSAKAVEVLKILLTKVEVEINTKQVSNLSLKELIQ